MIFADGLAKVHQLLVQIKDSFEKLYSVYALEVECIGKGKAQKRYEFEVKASVAVTNRSNFVLCAMALPGQSI